MTTPSLVHSEGYSLLDFGSGRKLERFGSVVVNRPEVLARGTPSCDNTLWLPDSTARFEETNGQKGHWIHAESLPGHWHCGVMLDKIGFTLICKIGEFKHLGVFPEQFKHWGLIHRLSAKGVRMLNLFGYTGAASIVGAIGGADVFHVDASKSIVRWASENAMLNGVSHIHWVCEDAMKFAAKEVSRGRLYDIIIMDPPVFGRGSNGEKWKLEKLLPGLMSLAAKLLTLHGTLILNTYSPAVSINDMKIIANKVGLVCKESGWLGVDATDGRKLQLSKFIVARHSF